MWRWINNIVLFSYCSISTCFSLFICQSLDATKLQGLYIGGGLDSNNLGFAGSVNSGLFVIKFWFLILICHCSYKCGYPMMKSLFCLFLNHLHTLIKKLNNLQNQLQGVKQTLREFFRLCAFEPFCMHGLFALLKLTADNIFWWWT